MAASAATPPPTLQQCSTCLYWQRPEHDHRGACRRYPQVVYTWSDYWCAEWKRATGPTATASGA